LDDVANFGFVPNGGRIYYLNRSQPPLLSEMVLALLEADAGLMEGECRAWWSSKGLCWKETVHEPSRVLVALAEYKM
jgi:neutral trehalase